MSGSVGASSRDCGILGFLIIFQVFRFGFRGGTFLLRLIVEIGSRLGNEEFLHGVAAQQDQQQDRHNGIDCRTENKRYIHTSIPPSEHPIGGAYGVFASQNLKNW